GELDVDIARRNNQEIPWPALASDVEQPGPDLRGRIGQLQLRTRDATELFAGGGKVVETGAHRVVCQRETQIAHGACHLGVGAYRQIARMSGDDGREAVVLVRIGLCMLVDKEQAAVVEQSSIAFR